MGELLLLLGAACIGATVLGAIEPPGGPWVGLAAGAILLAAGCWLCAEAWRWETRSLAALRAKKSGGSES